MKMKAYRRLLILYSTLYGLGMFYYLFMTFFVGKPGPFYQGSPTPGRAAPAWWYQAYPTISDSVFRLLGYLLLASAVALLLKAKFAKWIHLACAVILTSYLTFSVVVHFPAVTYVNPIPGGASYWHWELCASTALCLGYPFLVAAWFWRGRKEKMSVVKEEEIPASSKKLNRDDEGEKDGR
jgi:hypothetical protein